MNRKKILLLLFALLLIFPITVFGYQNGLVVENGKTYYYENGTRYSGFKEIDGKLYFFSYVTKSTLKGWNSRDGVNYFYANNDGTLLRGLQTIDGKKYYFGNDGIAYKGFKEIDGKLYFFSYVTRSTLTGWNSRDGVNYFYANNDGSLLRGLQTIDGKKYYFGNDGIAYKGFKEIDGKLYFFSFVTRTTLTGWNTRDGENYFYANNDGTLLRGLQTIDGKKYYFGNDGIAYKGFKEIDGKLYFFSFVTRTTLTGWNTRDGENYFYANNDGTLLRGLQTIDGKKYYFENNGIAYRGFKKIDGKIYFFSFVTRSTLTGWNTRDGENYFYADNDGALVTGNQHIDARDYKFGDDGIVQGFKTVNGKKYYYDPNGTMVKGVQRMCGTYMMFNSLTGVFEKTVNQKRVIDISVHNGNVNWDKVKESGLVDGVILRSSFGVGYTDGKFERNVKELNRLGIPYSVYHFSYAENKAEAKREADYLISVLNKYPVRISSNLFSIYYDLEDWEISSTGENSYGISKNTYADMITTFANTVQKATGIKVRVYASKNYIETRFPASVQGYATWVAQWSDHITYKGAYEGWQYTSKGRVPGIDGNVDMSIFYY